MNTITNPVMNIHPIIAHPINSIVNMNEILSGKKRKITVLIDNTTYNNNVPKKPRYS